MKILTKKIKKLRLSIHNVISAWYNEIDLRGEKMKYTSFVQLLHSGATNYPDNVALLYDEGGTTVKKTYAQLYADVKDRVRALESERNLRGYSRSAVGKMDCRYVRVRDCRKANCAS